MKTLQYIWKTHYNRRGYVLRPERPVIRMTLCAFTHTTIKHLDNGTYVFKDQSRERHPLTNEADYDRLIKEAIGSSTGAFFFTKAEAENYLRETFKDDPISLRYKLRELRNI